MSESPATVKRAANGTFLPGGPGGPGRKRMPEWFANEGDTHLRMIHEVACTRGHEYQYQAAIWCAERIYGKARQEVEVTGVELSAPAQALVALAEKRLNEKTVEAVEVVDVATTEAK